MKNLADNHKQWTEKLKAAKTLKDADICRQKLSEIQKAMASQKDVFEFAQIEEEKIDVISLQFELKKKETDLESCKRILKYKNDFDVQKIAYEISNEIEILEAKISKANQFDKQSKSVVKYKSEKFGDFYYDRENNTMKYESGEYYTNKEIEAMKKRNAGQIEIEMIHFTKSNFSSEFID